MEPARLGKIIDEIGNPVLNPVVHTKSSSLLALTRDHEMNTGICIFRTFGIRLAACFALLSVALGTSAADAPKTFSREGGDVWFVTGANRGIGLEISRAALAAGYRVVATSRHPDQVKAKLGTFGDRLLTPTLDVTDAGQAIAAVAAAKKAFGRIDVLVNNAGYGQLGWFENMTDAQVREQFEVNLFGSMNVVRAVLPLMRAQHSGYVVQFSSIAGQIAPAGSSTYSASKFAVEGWMEGLAAEIGPLGIHATIIEPGFFNTDFLDPSSVKYASGAISDYAPAATAFRAWHDDMNHKQQGDPARLGEVIVQLAGMKEPPLRFIAGSDGVPIVLKKAEELRAGAERMRTLSISTDRKPKQQ